MAAAKKACSVCGKSYKVPYIYAHLRNAHGVYGGASGETRERRNGKASTVKLTKQTITKPKPVFHGDEGATFTQLEGFVLLTDDDGGMWLAERIR